MKVIGLSVLAAIASVAVSASDAPTTKDLVGNWAGTSLCQVKPSPCHDENVVFRLSRPQADKVTIQADKIVDGKPVMMGTSEWKYDTSTQALIWEMSSRVWKLVVRGDEMNGTLTDGNVVFRKIHLHRLK